MKEIVVLNNPTLQELIDKNIQSKTSSVPVNKPYVNELKLSDDKKDEILEAAVFIKARELKAIGNRFAAKDNLNDSTLSEARGIVLSFIDKAQILYDKAVDDVNHNYDLKDALTKDIDGLLHSKKVISAIDALKKATQPIVDRMKEIDGGVALHNHYSDDRASFFGMEAVRRLHRD